MPEVPSVRRLSDLPASLATSGQTVSITIDHTAVLVGGAGAPVLFTRDAPISPDSQLVIRFDGRVLRVSHGG